MNYADRQLVKHLVTKVRENGHGFQDLIVAIVLSESFRTK